MNRKNTVDYQELLKRYYEGKTTLEEENLLRTHLLSHTEENHADATLCLLYTSMAKVAVVEDVGAKFKGQASWLTLTTK